MFGRESPTFLAPAIQVPRPNVLDARIQRADEHYLAGKRLFQSGDLAGARREFDVAIDALLSAPDGGDRQRIERKFDELVEQIYHYDVDKLGAGDAFQEPVYDKSPLDDIGDLTFPIDPRLRSQVKDEVAATSSQLPLHENDAVISFINYFSSERGRRVLATGLRRAGRYRPLIRRILDEEGVPQELIFLAQAESGFFPRALSRRQAAGMWQFVQWRGREYGLEQTGYSDDRLDPEKATRAAARHLHDLYRTFGDWYLAMAAYNCGPGCVDHAVQRTGYADFWELRDRNALPKETANYVPIILAMTIMAKNAKDYHLEDIDPDPVLEYDTVEVKFPTNVALIADSVERSTTEIRELNPALLRGVTPANYQLRVPKGTGSSLAAALENVPAEKRASWRMHKVAAGDTLTSIARRYGSSATSIAGANPRQAADLEAGDVLMVPCSYAEARKTPAKSAKSHQHTAASKSRHGSKHSVSAKTLHRRATVKRASR
jgi:membrane-bound lytic murein transglycosylase D